MIEPEYVGFTLAIGFAKNLMLLVLTPMIDRKMEKYLNEVDVTGEVRNEPVKNTT